MKKIEASLIKTPLRQALGQQSLELSHYSLSLSHYWSLKVFLEHSSFESRKEKQEKGKE